MKPKHGERPSSGWLDVFAMWAVLWALAGAVVALASSLTAMLVDRMP